VLVDGKPHRSIARAGDAISIVDQTKLPNAFERRTLRTYEEVAHAITTMQLRGAPLIGVAAAYGIALAMKEDAALLDRACETLLATRPTAVNLRWAVSWMQDVLVRTRREERAERAFLEADRLAEDDVTTSRGIGGNGLKLLAKIADYKKRVDVLTHCNAGWLATVDFGTALAPVYFAHDAGLNVHVWVSETRPRNQGALTAWELRVHGVPHTIVADNACGHLLARGAIDLCIVGADRVTARGDVANKIGTYLKALAARASNVPFYVAFPHSTIDWSLEDGAKIPIEERSPEEVTHISGARIAPEKSAAHNPAFDVTPRDLVTAFVTERGVCAPDGLRALYAK